MKWAKTECLRLKKEITKENLLDVLEPILKHIRFPAMDIKDFTTVVGSLSFWRSFFYYKTSLQ
jgi:hypothetical protein